MNRCGFCSCKIESGYHEPWCPIRKEKEATMRPKQIAIMVWLDMLRPDQRAMFLERVTGQLREKLSRGVTQRSKIPIEP